MKKKSGFRSFIIYLGWGENEGKVKEEREEERDEKREEESEEERGKEDEAKREEEVG